MDEENKKPESALEKAVSRRRFLKTAAVGGVAAGAVFGPGPAFGIISKKKYTIAIVPKGLSVPVFVLAKLGHQQRAKELGDVQAVFTATTDIETAGNISIINDLISSKVNAIGISCNDPKAYVPVINKAVDQGIKVMTWDSDAPSSKRSVFYGIDSFAVGKRTAQAMNRLLGGKGNIVIISGDPAALNLNLRVKGAKAGLAPGIKVLNTLYTKDDIPTAIAATEDTLRAHPDLDGLLMVGGWALFSNEGATPGLVKAKGKVKVVSFDVLQPTVAYLRDNVAQAVFTQDYWGWGYQSCTILRTMLDGKKWHNFIPQKSEEVTPKQWRLWDARWRATSKGVAAAAQVWKEPPLKPPGNGTGPLRG